MYFLIPCLFAASESYLVVGYIQMCNFDEESLGCPDAFADQLGKWPIDQIQIPYLLAPPSGALVVSQFQDPIQSIHPVPFRI